MPKKKSTDGAAPLTALERLKSLNLISKLSIDLQSQIGLSDKTLTEFIISLGESALKKSFKQSLKRRHHLSSILIILISIILSTFHPLCWTMLIWQVNFKTHWRIMVLSCHWDLQVEFWNRLQVAVHGWIDLLQCWIKSVKRTHNSNALLNSYPHEGQKSIKGRPSFECWLWLGWILIHVFSLFSGIVLLVVTFIDENGDPTIRYSSAADRRLHFL